MEMMLVVVCCLAAGPLWAVSNDKRAIGMEIETLAQTAPWAVSNDCADPMDKIGTPLVRPASAGASSCSLTATALSVPRTASMPSDRDGARTSDVAASFMLIGLGSGILICLRWRMGRSPQSDSISAS